MSKQIYMYGEIEGSISIEHPESKKKFTLLMVSDDFSLEQYDTPNEDMLYDKKPLHEFLGVEPMPKRLLKPSIPEKLLKPSIPEIIGVD